MKEFIIGLILKFLGRQLFGQTSSSTVLDDALNSKAKDKVEQLERYYDGVVDDIKAKYAEEIEALRESVNESELIIDGLSTTAKRLEDDMIRVKLKVKTAVRDVNGMLDEGSMLTAKVIDIYESVIKK